MIRSRRTHLRASLTNRSNDRAIIALALPALGALAIEPLYLLVDTAIVGHLGAIPLASLAIAGAILSALFSIFNFLTYGLTAKVAQLDGIDDRDGASELGIQGLWLSAAIGIALLVLILIAAPVMTDLLGARAAVARESTHYLRIAALAAPFFMLTSAAQGYLRGIGNLKTPLQIFVAAHIVNLILELLFVYGFHWGLTGSAAGTVIAQAGMGSIFVYAVARRRTPSTSWRPSRAHMHSLVGIGAQIALRTIALLAAFLVGSALAARIGVAALGGHQIAFQLWVFTAMLLDALAIAAQVMIGRSVGKQQPEQALIIALRIIYASVAAGLVCALVLLCLRHQIPVVFTSDQAVLRAVDSVWLLLVAMMPLNGAVFALDGILIGAGDTRFLMFSMIAATSLFIPVALLTYHLGWGLTGIWWALTALIVVRLLTCGLRLISGRWFTAAANNRSGPPSRPFGDYDEGSRTGATTCDWFRK